MTLEDATGEGRSGPRESHRAMADELRRRIRAGRPGPGGRLPSQAALAAEFGVERGTVRRVLALLRAEGLLLDAARGSRAVVAERTGPPPAEGAPLPTAVALGPRVAAAFGAPHVAIDALCRTAATLTLAVGEALRLIHAGRLRPESVRVRVLLPSRHIDLAFPTSVATGDTGADDELHSDWLAQRNAQGQVLRHNLRSLRASHGIRVDVAFRALPFTPPVKLYLLNGAEALFAYYTLGRLDRQTGQGPLETWDAVGEQSPLFPFEPGALRDSAFVEQSQLWFDALWNTISTDLVLGGPGG
ncbi:GntR family transcriptional regulator [Streptomyces sp. NPDC050560]|uniref:GntR family transcriptional regulator n=1 Tax=Streptomyces sp. NPDC050560 TaxID=3365630 RepID=UPI0037B64D6B